jgi:hypothetical protein
MTSSHVWALETGFSRLERTEMRDWGFSSVEEHLPAKCKKKNTKKKKKGLK